MSTITRTAQRRWPGTRRARRTLMGYFFISPFILGFFLWFIGPALAAVWLVFQDWNMIRAPRFIALGNFTRLFQDTLFIQSLKVTATYSFISVPLRLILGFAIALLMNLKVPGISAFRTIYYVPSIMPAVANAVLWNFVFNGEFGLLNGLLRGIGLPKVLWLQDPKWTMPAIILMDLWSLGAGMVIYLAGLQGIPDTLYEAAEIDGAGRWAKLMRITIPLMSPVIFFNLIIGIIGSFQVFTVGYLMTDGGPQNATLFYVLYTYRTAFQFLRMGYAAVLSWVLFFIIVGLTVLVFKYVGHLVYYEEAGS